MLFALLVLLFSNVDAVQNRFQIDTHAEYYRGWFWGWGRIPHSGSGCQICVKNGGGVTECKRGPYDDRLAWSVNLDYSNVAWNTWVWTNCNDALLIDRAMLWDLNNYRSWGMDGGGQWCLSRDINDNQGWEGYSGSGRCYSLLEFNSNGGTYYYHDFNWTPDGRRALQEGDDETVPTVSDFDECEADENTSQKACEALVNQIIDNIVAHPELREEAGTVEVETSDDTATVTMMTSTSSIDSWAIYGFAAVGLAFVMVQSFKVLKKQSSSDDVFTPVKSRDEL